VARDTCYFDGRCGLCRRSVAWLRRLDWLGRLAFIDIFRAAPGELPVGLDLAMTGMPMRTGDGRVLLGFPAVRRALARTPLGAVVAWALYLPGVSALGGRVYRSIALNRRRDACAIGPGAGRPA
jgi:predicted DCC family thiol-disulfide oxidoreductase YuxK